MLIAKLYAPKAGIHYSAEEVIVSGGGKALLDDIREVIAGTHVTVDPTKTTKKGIGGTGGKTGNPGLADGINKALAQALRERGWGPEAPPRAKKQHSVDWVKRLPGPDEYLGGFALGLETQFGNNFQVHGDLQRLAEMFNAGRIDAGIIVVPSRPLAEYLSDRCADIDNATAKLDAELRKLVGARAFRICPIMLIAVQHDAIGRQGDSFEITPCRSKA